MIRHLSGLTLLLLALLPTSPGVAQEEAAITIEQVQWGFDGKAQERTFLPLSVLVQNNTPLEFDGTLTLTKLVQSSKPIDASIARPVYVGPLSRRWVQFVPYVVSDWEQWRLTWGTAEDQRYDVPTPQIGDRATVLLYDPDDLQVTGGVLRRFPLSLFPASVTATDGLRGVVMDRPPRWQGARRQAFLDWLHLGGRVYLLQDDQGKFPTFPDSMQRLNRPGDRFLVGAGVVTRIPTTVRKLEPGFVKREILEEKPTDPANQRYQQYRKSRQYQGTAPLITRSGWDRDTQMFLDLQSVTRFARRWWVIYLLSLLYLLTLFPVCFRVGTEAWDYRWMYVVLLGSVAVFSYAFASLGRLGASELSRARSVAVARQLDDGSYDVTQWTCVGVRAGGRFEISHAGTGRQYSTSQDMERIDGLISAGTEAGMQLEIPPASTRTILHRSRTRADSLGLNVQQLALDERGLGALTLGVGPEFPVKPMLMLVVHAGRIYELQHRTDHLLLVPSSRESLATFLTEYSFALPQLTGNGLRTSASDENRDARGIYRSVTRTLVGNSFGLHERVDLQQLMLPEGIIRVFVYAPQPPALQITSQSFPDQSGFVLYCVDLPLRSGPSP